MFLREAPTQTIEDVRKALDTGAESVLVEDRDVKLSLTTTTPSIKFKSTNGTSYEVPVSKPTLEAVGSWISVPTAFLHRLEADLQQTVLGELLKRQAGTSLLTFTDEGIEEMRSPGNRVDLRAILDVVANVIDPKAPVVEWWREKSEFRLDVIAPETSKEGRYSPDAKARKVGEITAMGVRVGMDLKPTQSHTPWVSTLLYRLACTNGYEREDVAAKIDGRGATNQEVLNQLEEAVEEAFSNAQREVKAFYDLRNEKVANPERLLARIADEHELPDRTFAALIERAPALPDDANAFDVVNLITNQANDLRIRNKTGARRKLELVGGAIISEHADRCSHCKAKLH